MVLYVKTEKVSHEISHGITCYFMEMFVDFFVLPDGFYVYRISIYGFHYIVTSPSSALQNILVWDTDRVHNGCCIMTQIMKTEMGQTCIYNSPLKAPGNGIGATFYNPSSSPLHFFDYKVRIFNFTIAAIGLWLLDVVLPVRPHNHTFCYRYLISGYVSGFQGTYLPAAHGAECCQENSDLKVCSFHLF